MGMLQRRVAAEFGLPEEIGLLIMREANSLLPGDDEVNQISLYRKFNRCTDGTLSVRDAAPNVLIHELHTGEGVLFHDILALSNKGLMVMFAGSYS